MSYNLSMLTNSSNAGFGEFVCNSNYISNHFLAYVVLGLVLSISLTLLIKSGRTWYSSLPVSFFYTSVLATLGLLMSCQGSTAVPFGLVIIFWTATAIFVGIRVGIKGQ